MNDRERRSERDVGREGVKARIHKELRGREKASEKDNHIYAE